MKKGYLLHSLIGLLAVSCTVQEFDTETSPLFEGGAEEDVFYASLESFRTPDTRVYIDEDVKLLWDAEDELSIFNKNDQNQQYQFSGQAGDNSGCFTRVSDPVEAENDLDFVCAVYPYQETATISNEGVLTLTLPAEQEYREGSFGPGANVMVSKTDGNLLRFKNVGGYLALKFFGENISVSSIKLEGNNGEPLSGVATVTPTTGGIPEIEMASMAENSITLSSDEPTALGASAEESVLFWIVVPPTDFEKGFTLTVTDEEGHVFTKRTNKRLSIARNSVLRIAPIEVVPENDDLDISITGVTPVKDGINYAPGASINFKTIPDQDNRGFTITMPTVTNFSQFVFNFGLSGEVERLLANGKEIENGVTPIDATSPVTLTICKGKYGKNYTLTARNTGLPVVRITLEGFTLADIEADPVHQTEWRPSNIDDPSTGTASIRIELPDGTKDCETSMQIKGRGNATWGYPKRPYALKFPKGKSVLGMPSHKRWILLANWKDRTLLRNDAAFWISRQVSDVIEKNRESSSFPYTVKGKYVELEINGEHRGNYYLCEQIKINSKRVPITEMDKLETGATNPLAITGGYLMEIDNNWDDDNSFYSGNYPGATSNNGFKFKYQFKEPDEKDRSQEAYAYMTEHIARVESLIKRIPKTNNYTLEERQEYRNYIDVESAIWFMIINELTSNGDFYNENYSDTYKGPHSTYLYKDRDVQNDDGTTTVSKIHFGPAWDFDYLTFMPSRSNKWAGANQKNYYYNYFYADAGFKTEMCQLWNDYKSYFNGLPAYIDKMAAEIRLSAEFDGEMWWNTTDHGHADQDQNGELNMTFDQAVANIKSGYTGKLSYIDNNIGNLKYQNPSSSWGW